MEVERVALDNTVKRLRSLQVIIKTAERCNLACTYCYYFYMGDESYKDRDPILRKQTFPAIVEYLREGIVALHVLDVRIVFHGGEPTLQRPRDFRIFAQQLREALGPICNLHLGMQTNGYNLSDEWLEVLGDFNVEIGFSVDGPKEYHDRFRVNHKGQGSYDKIAKNIARFQEQVVLNKVAAPGVLSVIDYNAPIEEIFQHFTETLGFRHLGFLLPDRSWDDPFAEGESAEAYGNLLIRLFNLWTEKQDISVREISKILNQFQTVETPEATDDRVEPFDQNTQIVVIQSTGEINCDDSLMAALDWRTAQNSYSVYESKLGDFIHDRGVRSLERARIEVARPCINCKWLKVCGGGALENRFSKERGFDNPSVYCEGLKVYFEYIYNYLNINGYPADLLDHALETKGERMPTFVI